MKINPDEAKQKDNKKNVNKQDVAVVFAFNSMINSSAGRYSFQTTCPYCLDNVTDVKQADNESVSRNMNRSFIYAIVVLIILLAVISGILFGIITINVDDSETTYSAGANAGLSPAVESGTSNTGEISRQSLWEIGYEIENS